MRLPQKRDVPASFEPLADFLHARDIEYLDLASAKVPPGIHFQEDSHINPKGHGYVMGAVARWIEAHLPQLAGPAETR